MARREKRKGDGTVYWRNGKGWIKYYCLGKPHYEATGAQPDCGAAVYQTDRNAERTAHTYLDNVKKKVGSAELGHSTYLGAQVQKLTMNDLFDALEAARKAKEARDLNPLSRNAPWYSNLKGARRLFGELIAMRLDADWWDDWMQGTGMELMEEYAPASINRMLEKVREAFNLAVERRKLTALPATVRLYSERDNVREGFFEPEEFHALLQFTDNDDYKDFYTFGYLLGWRSGAVRGMQWSSIDLRAGEIQLPWKIDKARRGNKIPIGKKGTPLHTLIYKRWDARTYTRKDGTAAIATHVFHHDGDPIGDVRKTWASACRQAHAVYIEHKGQKGAALMTPELDRHGAVIKDDNGVAQMVPSRIYHDFRRTAYRNMRLAGVDKDIAQAIVGHTTDAMVKRYSIFVMDEKADALSRLTI